MLKEKERLTCIGCGYDTRDEHFKYCPYCGTKLIKVEKLMTDEELDKWMRGGKAEWKS